MTTLFNVRNKIASSLLYLLTTISCAAQAQQASPCNTPVNNSGIFCDASTTWNGTTWSNGEPQSDKDVIIDGDITFSAGVVNACSLTILNNSHVNFTQNCNAVIAHNIDVAANANLTFDSGCNLIQTEAQINTGEITIKRNSGLIKKNDYTLWSSPVEGQLLLGFSPQTLPNRFYTFSTVDNIYNTVSMPATTAFEKGKAYLIRTGENHPVTPAAWEADFTGTPNTGDIQVPLTYISENQSYNAVGNPYPSPISITKFLDTNSEVINGTIWLWRKTTNTAQSSYSVVTKFGYLSNTSPDNPNYVENPFDLHEEGLINTGQGFIVKANSDENLVFDNQMRLAVSSQSFFRTQQKNANNDNTSRFWLNVSAPNIFSQIIIGYTDEATLDYDKGLDGEAMMDGTTGLYSIADDKKLAIQARPQFEEGDTVPLGFKTATAGTYTLALNSMDGLFALGQDIFIKDMLTGTIHNFSNGGYTFTTDAGTFENRFVIIYNDTTMGTDLPTAENKTVVYSNDNKVKVKSQEEIISVTIYDLTGRTIFEQNNIVSTDYTSTALSTNMIVIAHITLSNGIVISKKIVIQ